MINQSAALFEAVTYLISRTRRSFSFNSVPVGNVSSVYVQLLRKFKSFFWAEFRGWTFVSNAAIRHRLVRHCSNRANEYRWLEEIHNSQVTLLTSCHEIFPPDLVFFCNYSTFSSSSVPLWVSAALYLPIVQRCQLRLRIFWGHFGSGAWRRVQNSPLRLAFTLTTKA